MFTKNILVLLTATLFSTSSVLAMERDERTSRILQRLKNKRDQKQQQCDVKHQPSFERVLNLYKDQIEHHRYMENFIIQERQNLNDEQKFEGSLHAILGLPLRSLRAATDHDAIPLDKPISEMLTFQQSNAKVFEDFIRLRQESNDPILKKIALIYSRSIINQQDLERKIEESKQNFQQATDLQENEVNDHYQIRAGKDKIEFYSRVQKKVLEEFSPYLNEIYEYMVDVARTELDKDNFSFLPQDFKMTKDDKAFYESVISKTYNFPTSIKIAEIIFEETLNIHVDTKKKKRKKRKRVRNVKNANTGLNLKKDEPSPRVKLSQSESDIQTEKEPLLPTHAEQTVDQINLLLEDNLKKEGVSSLAEKESEISLSHVESFTPIQKDQILLAYADVGVEEGALLSDNILMEESNWKHDLEVQIEKDRQQKIVPKKRTRINKTEELQPTLIKKAEIGKTEHLFFTEVCTTSVKNPNIAWRDLVDLFNNPNGFKGNVYGTSGGVTNTFEVFMKFKDGKFIDFLLKNEFNYLKSNAQAESRNERNFLKNNKRLESYRLSTGESIATSFFTLHNPHQPCLYMALLKRLRGQLDLLGLSPETVQSRD